MTHEELRRQVRSVAGIIAKQDPSRMQQLNAHVLEEADAEYRRFKEDFDRDICYLCGRPLASFSEKNVCLHWLLKPKGFKKKHFPSLGPIYGFFRMQSYLRWLANQEGFAMNINDMKDENAEHKISEVTICYRHLEWSFSCNESDYLGHSSTHHGRAPHFHFQMRVGGKQFINYSDFHVPFVRDDIIKIESIRAFPEVFAHEFPFGWGMQDSLREEMLPEIINCASIRTEDDDPSVFSISTVAQAEEGHLISGDDIADLIEEAKREKVALASLVHKLPHAMSQIIVSPGSDVVDKAPRCRRKPDV
jgi:hypothetical protein